MHPLSQLSGRSWLGSTRRHDSRAFTLVELLIVMAILGGLTALLLPALGRAKAIGQQTVCLNNLRQLALAQWLYAQDHEDRIARESFEPNGVTLNLWGQVAHPLARDVWYNALPRMMQIREARDYEPPASRLDFYSAKQVFHCPSARFPRRAVEDEAVFFSLAMNSKLILRPYSTMKVTAVSDQTTTVMFLDNRLPDEPAVDSDQTGLALGQPSAYANRFVPRHRGKGQIAFIDGHVGAYPGHVVVTNGLAPFPPTGITWTADPSWNPNLE